MSRRTPKPRFVVTRDPPRLPPPICRRILMVEWQEYGDEDPSVLLDATCEDGSVWRLDPGRTGHVDWVQIQPGAGEVIPS
jgi:hypothetical protein